LHPRAGVVVDVVLRERSEGALREEDPALAAAVDLVPPEARVSALPHDHAGVAPAREPAVLQLDAPAAEVGGVEGPIARLAERQGRAPPHRASEGEDVLVGRLHDDGVRVAVPHELERSIEHEAAVVRAWAHEDDLAGSGRLDRVLDAEVLPPATG